MINNKLEEILLQVQKPGRYIGGEINSVIKNKNHVDIRFAFCFPDIYEVGMSHLGIKILYNILNEKDYIWCERVFAPWVDMQKKMKENNILLFALESKDYIKNFDIIGFTLQYELSYTNVLKMLELAGVPLRSCERNEDFPIVIAGGPCSYNPEPLADFIDIFALGDGEEVILEIAELLRVCKKSNFNKKEFLIKASEIPGLYIPEINNKKIKKRIIKDLDKASFPEKLPVPIINIVHNRAVVEILRGCIRGCRFCQAGFIYRPFREKSPEVINKQCKNLYKYTGYDDISLSSLSSSDYSEINNLLEILNNWTEKEKISLSLPSMRVDAFSSGIMEKLKSVKKSGLTFAPEAGTQRLRNVINKNITEEELLNTCELAFKGGWNVIKLYFMIGLPTERDEDVLEIGNLAQKIVDLYYYKNKIKNKSVQVNLSVSCFVPKAFTPFQWEKQDSLEELERKQKLLKTSIKSKKIKFNYHENKTSFLEGIFARGDKKLGRVLEEALKLNCIFDGWSECFNFENWLQAFKNSKVNPEDYTRKRDFKEELPWDFIDINIKKEFFIKECEKSYKEKTTPNCREACSNCGLSCKIKR